MMSLMIDTRLPDAHYIPPTTSFVKLLYITIHVFLHSLFFYDSMSTKIYPLSLHDSLAIHDRYSITRRSLHPTELIFCEVIIHHDSCISTFGRNLQLNM